MVKVAVSKALIGDVKQIHALVNKFADRDEMLPRALSEIYENLRDFYVVRRGKRILGCVALHIAWEDLAEVRSLAVAEDNHRQGLGSEMVQACLAEARELGIGMVFCLTYKPDFFKKQGFELANKHELPRKVWGECFHCPKFPDCDEIALVWQAKKG